MAIIRKPILELAGRRFGPVVFYRLPCGLICRALHPHTRKRILKDPRFAEFRKCSKRMGRASKIGSAIYRALPEDFRQFWMYRAFVGEAMKMLKDGAMTGEQVLENLFRTYVEVWHIKAETSDREKKETQSSAGSTKHNRTVEINIHWKEYNEPIRLRKAGNKGDVIVVGAGPPDQKLVRWNYAGDIFVSADYLRNPRTQIKTCPLL